MRALPAALYADLLAVPYAPGGRGPAQLDCVGLVCTVLRRMGRTVPAYLSTEEELHRELAAGGVLEDCRRLPAAEPGAVARLRMTGGDEHFGVMVDAYRMLHTCRQTGRPVVESTLTPLWQRRILGFYAVGVSA